MRIIVVLVAAVMASGCGLLGSLTRSDSRPRPIKLVDGYSKVNDTHRVTFHSNEPQNDQY
jgi:hypothetical protein